MCPGQFLDFFHNQLIYKQLFWTFKQFSVKISAKINLCLKIRMRRVFVIYIDIYGLVMQRGNLT